MSTAELPDVPSPWLPIAVVLGVSAVIDLALDLAWVALGSVQPSFMFFAQVALWWTAWVVLAPVVARLAVATRPERLGWGPVIAGHVVLGPIVATAQTLLAAFLFTLPGVAEEPSPWNIFLTLIERFGVPSFAIYLAAIAASLVYRDFHRSQAARLSVVAAEKRAAELEAAVAAEDLDQLSGDLRPEVVSEAFADVAALIRGGRSDDAVREIAILGDRLRSSLPARTERSSVHATEAP